MFCNLPPLPRALLLLLACLDLVLAQGFTGVYTTTADRSSLFEQATRLNSSIFTSASSTGGAGIVIDDQKTFQTIDGFGASLTDSSAGLLNKLKSTNSAGYWNLLGYAFDPSADKPSAGLSYLRVPLGASDFSPKEYSYDDSSGDTTFQNFNIDAAPSYVFSTIKDIQSVNPILKIHIVPWSPPAWMKTHGSMNGGSLRSGYIGQTYATYLLKCVQGFASKNITPYAISIQNEPLNENPTYPSARLTYQQEAQIGIALRKLLNHNGFTEVSIVGYEHNWNDASGYPVELIRSSESSDSGISAFVGVAFHCYSGNVKQQLQFSNAYPQKGIWMTECTGMVGSDWWTDLKWYMENLMIGAVNNGARAVLMWNFALDGSGKPALPTTRSCAQGCRGVVQVNSNGTWSANQEFFALAHVSKATLPENDGGPWAKRIDASVKGSNLLVGAFVTQGTDSRGNRYSLVVLNSGNSVTRTTIAFRGEQTTYSFPVGLTTLQWYSASGLKPLVLTNSTVNTTMA